MGVCIPLFHFLLRIIVNEKWKLLFIAILEYLLITAFKKCNIDIVSLLLSYLYKNQGMIEFLPRKEVYYIR